MVRGVLRRVRHQPVAFVALFLALGGGAFAAVSLPPKSVGSKQIKNKAVTPRKLSKTTVKLLRGKPGPEGPAGPQGRQGPPGQNGTNATIDGVAAGGDLTGTYPNPTVDTGKVQARVSGTCGSGGAISSINQDGTVGCNAPSAIVYAASSGPTQTLTTLVTGQPGNVAELPLDGSTATTGTIAGGLTIDTTNTDDVAQVFPTNETITGISAFASTDAALPLVGTSITITARLYTAQSSSNTFTPTAVSTTLSPALTGAVPIGTTMTGATTGLNVAVPEGMRGMIVVSASATGGGLINAVPIHISASMSAN